MPTDIETIRHRMEHHCTLSEHYAALEALDRVAAREKELTDVLRDAPHYRTDDRIGCYAEYDAVWVNRCESLLTEGEPDAKTDA